MLNNVIIVSRRTFNFLNRNNRISGALTHSARVSRLSGVANNTGMK
jgi:hypothetical protein